MPAETDDLFSDDPDGLWSTVLRRQGGPYALLSLMPPDPSLTIQRDEALSRHVGSSKLAVGTRTEGGPMEEGRKTRRAPLPPRSQEFSCSQRCGRRWRSPVARRRLQSRSRPR